jgi:hypothetical protein
MTSKEHSAQPSHELWVELATRITSRDLHFRSGQEEAALTSIVDVFKATRALMRGHREASEFLQLATVMLQTIRPYTARWHALQDSNHRFIGPMQRRKFRRELIELQERLVEFTKLFEALSQGRTVPVPRAPANKVARLGAPIEIGIGNSRCRPPNHMDIDACERAHVAQRRGMQSGPATRIYDGAGMALSGGGIRSATFCLGVAQVLAEKKLLSQFDYVSTVSGGGYFGSFLSNLFTNSTPAPDALGQDFDPRAEESPSIRHLRNSSEYLLPKTTLERLKLAGLLLSGVLATTLLAVAVPIAAAAVFRLVAHIWGFEAPVRNVFFAAAAIAGLIVGACWLVRPVIWFKRIGRESLDTIAAYFAVIAAVALAFGATPWVLDKLGAWPDWEIFGFSIASLATLVTGAMVVKAMRVVWTHRKALSRLFILSGVVLFAVVYLAIVSFLGDKPGGAALSGPETIVLCALSAWSLWAVCINLNETGLHRYYRDRLAECYLDAQSLPRSIASPPPLTHLSERMPFHLINTTVNLTSSRSAELRGRGGDFFLLSKFFCGSPLMGYQQTAAVTRRNPDLDLATAMAISGAAASTNMGWQTLREYRTLMAIFNVRLGYWMHWNADKSRLRANAFVQLMREIFGSLKESSTTINLSDGGHIENLAAYELIRRRLRYIVCVDGGMDGDMTCADLNRLQRLVAIDFGYRIEFDAADLKPINKYSTDYGMLVKIDYAPEETDRDKAQLGWMLYIKLAMLGTEASYVIDYQRQNPLFPHQSTADQFFDEAQFEAYRKLGESAARNFFLPPFKASDDTGAASFERWFRALAQHLLKDTDPVFA